MRNVRLMMYLIAATALSVPALAQIPAGFPTRPVTFINPLAPGGSTEVEARLYIRKLNEMTGQSFLLDFKIGAGGTIGAGYVARSAPDGTTLLISTNAISSFPALYKDLSFDPVKDLAPVSLMSEKVIVLLTRSTFPAKNMQEYLAYARANPGKINFATSGAGGGVHLAGAWLHSATKTQATFVHYKGTGPIMPDLLTGRVDATTAALVVVWPLIKSGKLHVMGITGDKRSNLLAGVPTVAEQGVPEFNYSNWVGILAPGTTPAAVIDALYQALSRIAKMPDVAAALEPDGNAPVGSTPAAFRQFLNRETDRWKKVVAEADIRLE